MAKPVLLVTRKLPEAIEARAAQDYDVRLNPQDAPWATDGAEIARRATEASAALGRGLVWPNHVCRGSPKGGCPGVSGTLTMPGRTLTCRASGKPGLASGLPLGREFRIAYLARSHEKSPTRLRADHLGQADSPIQDSQALAPIFA